MSPARSMHHTIGAHTIVRRVTVGLQDAVEGCEKLSRAIPSAPKSEVEHHRSAWTPILPKIGLMVLASAVLHLYRHGRFIGLQVSAAHQFLPHSRGDWYQQLADL